MEIIETDYKFETRCIEGPIKDIRQKIKFIEKNDKKE